MDKNVFISGSARAQARRSKRSHTGEEGGGVNVLPDVWCGGGGGKILNNTFFNNCELMR